MDKEPPSIGHDRESDRGSENAGHIECIKKDENKMSQNMPAGPSNPPLAAYDLGRPHRTTVIRYPAFLSNVVSTKPHPE